MNDEKETPKLEPRKSPMERLGENIELLSKRFENVEQTQKTDAERIQKVNTTLDLFKYDLQNPRREHGYTPTRKLAREAYNQSKGFISTENLEGHKVIKDLDEQLNKYVGQANMKFNQLRREISNIPSPDNMHDLLNENFKFKKIQGKIEEIKEGGITNYNKAKDIFKSLNDLIETYNGNDHPTGPEFEAVEMDYETLRNRHDELVHFLMGVFSSMKMDPVSKCIENYKVSVAE